MENFLSLIEIFLNFFNLKGGERINRALRLSSTLRRRGISLEGAREVIKRVGEVIDSGIRGVKIKLTIYEYKRGGCKLVPVFIDSKGEEVDVHTNRFISQELYDFLTDGLLTTSRVRMKDIYESYYKYRLDMSKGERFDLVDGQVMAGGKAIKPGRFARSIGLDEGEASLFADAIMSNQLLTLSEDMVSRKKVSEVYNSSNLKIGSCMTGKGYDLSVTEEAGAEVLCLSNLKGEIVARTLLWEGKYFDRIYAISRKLEFDFEFELEEMGYEYIEDGDPDYKTKWVEGNPFERFIPFMDTLDSVEIDGNRFRFCVSGGTHEAKRTDGDLGDEEL